jgi:O-antigen ligase
MTLLAVAPAVQGTVALAATLAAALVLLLPDARRRAPAMVAASLLAALALVSVLGDDIRDAVEGREAAVAAAGAVGLVVLVAGAWLFRRRPELVLVLAFATLPIRIPLDLGGDTANLLLPLYAVIACGVLARSARRRPREPEPRDARIRTLERVLAAVTVLYAVQALYSSDVEAAVKNICFFYVPFTLLFRLLLDLSWTPRLVRLATGLTVALALLCVVVGLVQFATRELLLVNEKVLTANEIKPYFRVNSLFFDPNIYGRFLALTMVLIAALLLWTPHRRVVWIAAAVLAALWAGLVPSLSESSFGALAVGLAVLAALRWSARPILLTVGALAVVAVAVVVAFPSVAGLESRSFRAVDKATAGRAKLIRGGVEIFADRPIQGYGSGSFASQYRERERLLSERAPAESHTIPLTVGAEQGLIGLAGYLLLMWTALRLQLRGARETLPRAAVAAAFCGLVLHTLVYAAFLEDPLTWALLAAAGGLRRVAPGRSAPPPPARAASPRRARPAPPRPSRREAARARRGRGRGPRRGAVVARPARRRQDALRPRRRTCVHRPLQGQGRAPGSDHRPRVAPRRAREDARLARGAALRAPGVRGRRGGRPPDRGREAHGARHPPHRRRAHPAEHRAGLRGRVHSRRRRGTPPDPRTARRRAPAGGGAPQLQADPAAGPPAAARPPRGAGAALSPRLVRVRD